MKGELLIVLLIILGAGWVFYYYTWSFYLFILTVLLCVFYIFFVKKYDEFERGIIFRMGRFNRVVGPGWSVVVPFFEKEFARVDARTQMLKLDIDETYTSDDLRLEVDGLFYYKITNPEKAILKIDNYEKGIKNMITAETRNAIGSLKMREVFANINKLNELLENHIRHNSWKWGIDISMIQLNSVTPPVEIAEAMEEKEIAAQELQAQRFKSEAQKVILSALGEGAEELDDKAVMYLYLKAIKELGQGEGAKILFPAKFTEILDSMGESLKSDSLKGLDTSRLIKQVKEKILENRK